MDPLIFQSERLLFSPLSVEDAGDLFAYASDPEVARYTSWEAHRTLEDTVTFLQHVIRRHHAKSDNFHVVWAIRKKGNPTMIGTISCRAESSTIAHIDYALSRQFWGKGLIPEAVKMIIKMVPTWLPEVREIHSGCLDLNKGSVRVLEKCGFTRISSFQSEREGKFGGALLTTHTYILSV